MVEILCTGLPEVAEFNSASALKRSLEVNVTLVFGTVLIDHVKQRDRDRHTSWSFGANAVGEGVVHGVDHF